MRKLLILSLMMSLICAARADIGDTHDTIDNFQPPPMTSPLSAPMEQPLPPEPSTTGYGPGINRQTIPTPLQQTGSEVQTLSAPLTVDADLNFTDLMTDEVTLQYQYFYQDVEKLPWKQDAAVFANRSTDQSIQIQRFSDVIYLSLYLVPAGRGPLECMPAYTGQAPTFYPESLREVEVVGKVLPQVNHVEVIGTTDADGNGHCQLVIL